MIPFDRVPPDLSTTDLRRTDRPAGARAADVRDDVHGHRDDQDVLGLGDGVASGMPETADVS